MTITVRVKKGRMLTIRQIERDQMQPQTPPQRDRAFADDRPRPQFSKPKKKFAVKKNRSMKPTYAEGNRVGDIKRLDTRGKLTSEERIARLMQLAEQHGAEYLENELQTHRRKAIELEEALRRHKNARVDRGVQKLADEMEKELNPGNC